MITKKSYKQIMKLLEIIYDSENPQKAFQGAIKIFGKNFISTFFFAKEIKGYIRHLQNPDRLTLTSEGFKAIQEYRRERQQSNFNKQQSNFNKQQSNFNKILAFTGSILALISIYNFLYKLILQKLESDVFWLISIIFLILMIMCLGPLSAFIINYYKKWILRR